MAAADYYNVSQMEENPFEENESYIDRSYLTFINVIVWLRLLLYLVVIVADVFLICVISRNKKLRTRPNMYILNWCVIHACLYLKDPVIFIFSYVIFREDIIYYCIEIQSHTAVMSLYFTFALILAADWLLAVHKPQTLSTYKKHYKYFIFGLYILFGIQWVVSSTLCVIISPQTNFTSYFTSYGDQVITRTVVYVITLIGIIVLNILAKKLALNSDSLKTAYAMTVANVIFFSYLPMLIHYLLTYLFTLHRVIEYLLIYTEFIPEFLAATNNICVIYMLGSRNKHFKIAYDRCFKKSIKEYDTENLNESEEESENDANNSKIAPNEVDGQRTEAILVL